MTMSTTASAPHYLEDLSIGQRFVSASHTLDHAQIIAFVLQRNGRIREGSPARTPGQERTIKAPPVWVYKGLFLSESCRVTTTYLSGTVVIQPAPTQRWISP